MNRFVLILIFLSVITCLTGCQPDRKQAMKIYEKLNESVTFEKKFTDNQKELDEYRQKIQQVYNELVSFHIDDTEKIKQKLEEANSYTKNQQKFLKDTEKNFQKAYEEVVNMEGDIKEIKDKDQKKQATKMLTLMKNRKKTIHSFFENYQDQLEVQATFYKQLKNGKFRFDKLDQQINMINEYDQKMEDIAHQFNQQTDQYYQVENKYYQMTDHHSK